MILSIAVDNQGQPYYTRLQIGVRLYARFANADNGQSDHNCGMDRAMKAKRESRPSNSMERGPGLHDVKTCSTEA